MDAVLNLLNVETICIMILTVALGLIIGAIPGLNATMSMALLTPLTYAMDDEMAFVILCSLYVGAISGGLYSAILLKIPGTPASIATSFDGFPLCRQGKAGMAIGYGLVASFFGGLISFILLATFAPVLARFALKFGPSEYFMLSVLGLSTIASVIGKSLVKDFLSAGFGLVIGTVGLDVIMGFQRYTFGSLALTGGFDSMALMIGLFAIPQILKDIASKDVPVVQSGVNVREMLPSPSVLWKNKINILRSSLIGTWIGLLPGSGASIASLMAYDQTQKTSKSPEEFGKGAVAGIIASESANNASIGGAIIPVLTLGIPGDTPAAVLLAAFTLHGMQCGPLLYTQQPDMINTVIGSLFISNLFMIAISFVGARFIIKTLSVPKHYLLPIVILMCVVGSYALNNREFDVIAMLFFGVFGFLMERYNISTGPMVLGVILGPLLEKNLRRAVQVSNAGVFGILNRPITLVLFAIMMVSLFLPVIRRRLEKKKLSANDTAVEAAAAAFDPQMQKVNRIIGMAVLVFVAGYVYLTLRLPKTTMGGIAYGPTFYPLVLSGLLTILAMFLIFHRPGGRDVMNTEELNMRKLLIEAVAILLYAVAFIEIGFVVSSVVFLTFSIAFIGSLPKKKWIKAFLSSALVVIVIWLLFENVFNIFLPHGTLF